MSLDDVTQDKICVMEFHQKKVSRAQKNSVTFTALPFPRAQGRLYNTFYGIHWIRYRTANNSNSKTHHHMKFPHRFLSLTSIFHAMDDNDCKRVSLSVSLLGVYNVPNCDGSRMLLLFLHSPLSPPFRDTSRLGRLVAIWTPQIHTSSNAS